MTTGLTPVTSTSGTTPRSASPLARVAAAGVPVPAGRTPQRYRLYQLITSALGIVLAAVGVSTGVSLAQGAAESQQRVQLIAQTRTAEAIWWQAHAAAAAAIADPSAANTHTEKARELQAEAATALLEVTPPADSQGQLAAPQRELVSYVRAVERAFAVGSAQASPHLEEAWSILTERAAPALDHVITNQSAHLAAGEAPLWVWGLPWAGVGGAAVMLTISVSLARRSRRILTIGVAAALAAAVGYAWLGFAQVGAATADATPSTLISLTSARVGSAEGRAMQIHGAATNSWSEADTTTFEGLLTDARVGPSDLRAAVNRFAKASKNVTQALTARKWAEATTAALKTGDDTAATGFSQLEARAAEAVAEELSQETSATANRRLACVLFAVGTAALGVVIAIGGISGLGTRLKEYR